VLAGPSSRRSRVQIPHSALRPCDRGRMAQAAAFQAALCGFDSRRSLQVVGWPLQGTRRAGGNGNRAGLENHGPASRPVGVRILCPPLARFGFHDPGWCSGSTRGSDPRRATFESSTGSNRSNGSNGSNGSTQCPSERTGSSRGAVGPGLALVAQQQSAAPTLRRPEGQHLPRAPALRSSAAERHADTVEAGGATPPAVTMWP
jgi:hypothetical protein